MRHVVCHLGHAIGLVLANEVLKRKVATYTWYRTRREWTHGSQCTKDSAFQIHITDF